jgi:hypothetical protein
VTHQPPPEVQAAAAVCKEDPGAADACKVVTKFIQGGFWGTTAARFSKLTSLLWMAVALTRGLVPCQ